MTTHRLLDARLKSISDITLSIRMHVPKSPHALPPAADISINSRIWLGYPKNRMTLDALANSPVLRCTCRWYGTTSCLVFRKKTAPPSSGHCGFFSLHILLPSESGEPSFERKNYFQFLRKCFHKFVRASSCTFGKPSFGNTAVVLILLLILIAV